MAWESYFDGSWAGAADSSDARAGKWTTETDTGSLGSIVSGKYVINRPTASSTVSYVTKSGLTAKTRVKAAFTLTFSNISGITVSLGFRTQILNIKNNFGGVVSLGLYKDPGSTLFNKIQLPAGGTAYVYPFAADTPYLFEVEVQTSTTSASLDGWYKCWVNGVLIINVSGVNTFARDINSFLLGDSYISDAQQFTSTYEGFNALSYKADPVSEGSQTLNNNIVTLSGTGFGTTVLTPLLNENFNAYTGIVKCLAEPYPQLTVFSNQNTTQPIITPSGRKNKGIQHNYTVDASQGQSDWQRTAIDLGSSQDKLYITFWLKLDKTENGTVTWQWKPYQLTSSEHLYYDLSPTYPADSLPESASAYNTTAVFTSCWWSATTQSFFNTAGDVYYYDNVTDFTNKHGVSPTGAPADRFVFGEWQRVELYAKRSSGGGIADGIWSEFRVGRSSYNFNYTNAITHLTGNDSWRYLILSHAIESVYSGTIELDITFDDLYISTTQARIELGNAPVWSDCTHRELQTVTSWSDTEAVFTVDRGTFNVGDTVYAYLVTDGGIIKQIGSSFQITESTQSSSGMLRRHNFIKFNLSFDF